MRICNVVLAWNQWSVFRNLDENQCDFGIGMCILPHIRHVFRGLHSVFFTFAVSSFVKPAGIIVQVQEICWAVTKRIDSSCSVQINVHSSDVPVTKLPQVTAECVWHSKAIYFSKSASFQTNTDRHCCAEWSCHMAARSMTWCRSKGSWISYCCQSCATGGSGMPMALTSMRYVRDNKMEFIARESAGTWKQPRSQWKTFLWATDNRIANKMSGLLHSPSFAERVCNILLHSPSFAWSIVRATEMTKNVRAAKFTKHKNDQRNIQHVCNFNDVITPHPPTHPNPTCYVASNMCATSTMSLHPTPPTHPNPTCYVASNMCATSTMSLHPTPPTQPNPRDRRGGKCMDPTVYSGRSTFRNVVTSDWSQQQTPWKQGKENKTKPSI